MKKTKKEFIQDCKRAIFKLKVKEIKYIFGNKKRYKSLAKYNFYTEAIAQLVRITKNKSIRVLQSNKFFFIKKLFSLQNKYNNNKSDYKRIALILLDLIENTDIYNNLGLICLDEGKIEDGLYFIREGVRLFRERKVLEEEDWKLLNNYMYCLNLQNKPEEMIEELKLEIFRLELLEKKLKSNSSLFKVLIQGLWVVECLMICYIWLGIAYGRVFQHKEAKLYFDKAKEYRCFGFFEEFLYNALASYYIDTCDYAKAKEYALKAIEVEPNSAEAYANYGMACVFSGDKEEARRFLVKAYKNSPDDKGIKYNLLLFLVETGDLPLPTPCPDEDSYIEELVNSGEADKYLKKIITNE